MTYAALEASPPIASKPAATKPRPEVAEEYGKVRWDTAPDPRPSRTPLYLALAVAAVLGGGGYGLWYLFYGKSATRTAPEERKRQQFQVPEQKDELRQRFGPAQKSAPAKSKSEEP